MYTEISAETSLFFLDDDTLVFKFFAMSEKMSKFDIHLNPGGVDVYDVWIIAFNIWLMLQPDELNIIESAEKTLYYTSNFIIFNAIKKDYHFKYIKTNEIKKPELLYLISVLLAEKLNQWIADIMINANMTDILQRNRTRSYFKSHMGTEDDVKQFIEDQAKFVKAIVPILSTTQQLERIIKKSYDEAVFLYEKEYISLT